MPPIEHCPAPVFLVLHMFFGPCMVLHKTLQHASTVFLVFLHMFLGPCMVLHKTLKHGSTCSFHSAKELNIVILIFLINYVLEQFTEFENWTSRYRTCYQPLAQFQDLRIRSFLLYLNNFDGQKVEPCSRTPRFFTGLHYQAQKARRILLDWGTGGGGGV